jgi:SAM-dependent methyltransferase
MRQRVAVRASDVSGGEAAGHVSPMPTPMFSDIRVLCPLCRETSLRAEFKLRVFETDFFWDRCNTCGLVFQNPKLTRSGLQTLYKASAYFGGSNQSAYDDFTKNDAIRINQSYHRLDLIKSRAGVSGGSLLDIGSASGFFGYAAKQRGFEVVCVEPDEEMCAFGRSRYGLDMRAETLETFDAEGRQYDIVTLWGTDSHFENPVEGFSKINSMLKPGGILAMNFQDFDHPIRKLFPDIKRSWNSGYNFSDKSLKILLEKSGFAVRWSRTEWQQTTLGHIARVTKTAIPDRFKRLHIKLPTISFKIVLANRK